MKYQQIGNQVKKLYDQAYSRRYRERDEFSIVGENLEHIGNILKDISRSFGHKILVLDLGCGTGRYFHCLQNVERLTGIDISPHMLEEARNPVKKKEIRIDHIDLICTNIFEVDFPAHSFDFIYSIGVLGEYSPFDLYISNKLFDWLKPGGKLFFTILDSYSKWQYKRLRRQVTEIIYPLLPSILKRKLRRFHIEILKKFKMFCMTNIELKDIMENSNFTQYEISRHVYTDPGWKVAQHKCIAIKEMATSLNNG